MRICRVCVRVCMDFPAPGKIHFVIFEKESTKGGREADRPGARADFVVAAVAAVAAVNKVVVVVAAADQEEEANGE